MSERADRYDILIAGAGFAGAITALVLHSRGFSVCLVEKGRHPRFAIGESSTPIADLLLRDLSVRYDLPWLYAFSRYGSWQEAGARDALERATGLWQQALREYQEPALDEAVREELEAYITRRRTEIGAGEP